MESKRKITISPDILHEIGYDEEGISVAVENDLVFWCDSENPVHVEGMSAWQEWFESVTDFVAGHMDATSIDMIKWHCKGLQLASELKKKLPESVEVWYDRPFEDKSDILQGPVRMFKCFSPEMMRLLGEMVLNDDEYLNEFHKNGMRSVWKKDIWHDT